MNDLVFGIFIKRERWGLSWKGWLLMLAGGTLLGAGVFWRAYPFLAINQRLETDCLVVEGWVPPFTIHAAVEEINQHHYNSVFTTGGPSGGSGPYTTEYNTSAHVAYTRLLAAGISTNVLHKVPSHIRDRDRTYSAALEVPHWFKTNNLPLPRNINILTESVHARRSRLLYQKALGPGVRVGIIAVPTIDYPANRWWKYSEGVKEVISEGAAYIYARLFFFPGTREDPETRAEPASSQ